MLKPFWQMCLDGDLSRLVEYGECSEKELSETWERLNMEYADLVSDETRHTHAQINKAEQYRAKANWVATTVFYLRTTHNEALAQKLKSYFKGQGITLNILDPFQYQRDLNKCIALSKQWQFELDKIEGVLKEVYSGKNGKHKSQKITYESLYRTLIPMAKFMGGQLIDPKVTSVLDYVLIYSTMQKAYQENKEKNERNG